jgi:abequosyltransferase
MPMTTLSITIPTFNRAQLLDAQIARLADSAHNHWDDCQLVVSDNASTDDTPAICQHWRSQLGDRLVVYRQPVNLGLIGNFCSCVQRAAGTHTWIVSDDDPIEPTAVSTVLDAIRADEQLGFLHLNYRTTNNYGGAVVQAQVYPWGEDLISSPGVATFVRCLEYNELFLSCITACCVRTDLARQAILAWPAGVRNIAYPVFVSGFAVLNAPMRLSTPVSLTYPLHTMSHLSRWLVTLYHDLPEVYLELAKLGLNAPFMRSLILERVSVLSFIRRFPLDFLKSLRIYREARRLAR